MIETALCLKNPSHICKCFTVSMVTKLKIVNNFLDNLAHSQSKVRIVCELYWLLADSLCSNFLSSPIFCLRVLRGLSATEISPKPIHHPWLPPCNANGNFNTSWSTADTCCTNKDLLKSLFDISIVAKRVEYFIPYTFIFPGFLIWLQWPIFVV